MNCGVGHRHSLDLALLWLEAVALIRPLAWEPPYAAGEALKSKQTNKQTKNPSWVIILAYVLQPGS